MLLVVDIGRGPNKGCGGGCVLLHVVLIKYWIWTNLSTKGWIDLNLTWTFKKILENMVYNNLQCGDKIRLRN